MIGWLIVPHSRRYNQPIALNNAVSVRGSGVKKPWEKFLVDQPCRNPGDGCQQWQNAAVPSEVFLRIRDLAAKHEL